MAFTLDNFQDTTKWTAVLIGNAQIINRTATSFQVVLTAPTDAAWLISNTAVDVRDIPLNILADLHAGTSFLAINNSPLVPATYNPTGTPSSSPLDGNGHFALWRSAGNYIFLAYNGGGFPWTNGEPTQVNAGTQAKYGFTYETATGLIHGFWQDAELNNAGTPPVYTTGTMPYLNPGYNIANFGAVYVAVGSFGIDYGCPGGANCPASGSYNYTTLGTTTFTTPGAPAAPSISITPVTSKTLLGNSLVLTANPSNPPAGYTIGWYLHTTGGLIATGSTYTVPSPSSPTTTPLIIDAAILSGGTQVALTGTAGNGPSASITWQQYILNMTCTGLNTAGELKIYVNTKNVYSNPINTPDGAQPPIDITSAVILGTGIAGQNEIVFQNLGTAANSTSVVTITEMGSNTIVLNSNVGHFNSQNLTPESADTFPSVAFYFNTDFAATPIYALTVGMGAGGASMTPASGMYGPYTSTDTEVITATPSAGYVLLHFLVRNTVTAPTSGNSLSLPMNANKWVFAEFAATVSNVTLTVNSTPISGVGFTLTNSSGVVIS